MASQPKTRYTPEEYLALERSCEAKHEYYRGSLRMTDIYFKIDFSSS